MNEIRVKRMLVAALAMLLVWVAVEILVENVAAYFFLGKTSGEMWTQAIGIREWRPANQAISIFVAVLNCTILIWLYASLRPMFGVWIRTALITCGFGIAWMISMFLNLTNLGVLPTRLILFETVFEIIEFPIAMIAGAAVYEGDSEEARKS